MPFFFSLAIQDSGTCRSPSLFYGTWGTAFYRAIEPVLESIRSSALGNQNEAAHGPMSDQHLKPLILNLDHLEEMTRSMLAN